MNSWQCTPAKYLHKNHIITFRYKVDMSSLALRKVGATST